MGLQLSDTAVATYVGVANEMRLIGLLLQQVCNSTTSCPIEAA